MTKKIVLTVMIIVALLIAVYKWIMEDDIEIEEQQKVEETGSATNEKEETVNGNKAEEATTEDIVENHK